MKKARRLEQPLRQSAHVCNPGAFEPHINRVLSTYGVDRTDSDKHLSLAQQGRIWGICTSLVIHEHETRDAARFG